MKTTSYSDDNFGNWSDMDDPEVQAFASDVSRRSVRKTCGHCGRKVNILPDYAICNDCADRIESGRGE